MLRMKRDRIKDRSESDGALERMDAALKAALKMPPRKHKDEKKGRKSGSKKR